MAAATLTKGQNTTLGQARLGFRFVTVPADGVDISALLLGASGKVRTEPDFVFYNQPVHPSGAARHSAATNQSGDSVEVFVTLLETDVERVIIAASMDSGSIRTYQQARLVVRDLDSGHDIYEINVIGEGNESAMVLAEVYRRNGTWKLRAVSQGYDAGLAGLATDYGIDVSPPVSAPTATRPPTRSATPTPSPPPPTPEPHPGPNSRPATPAPATPAPTTAEPTVTGPSAPHPKPRGGARTSSPPALVTASQDWDLIRRRSLPNVALVGEIVNEAMLAFAGARPSIDGTLHELDTWYKDLRVAWSKRFHKEAHPANPGSEPWSLTSFTTPPNWIGRAKDLISELDSRTVKLTSDSRRKYRIGLARIYSELVAQLPATRMGLRQTAWDTMANSGPGHADAAARATAQRWAKIPTLPPPVGQFMRPLADDGSFARGVGPTRVLVGYARPETITFTTDRPATPSGSRPHRIELPSIVRFPVVLDLDRVGGFVTATPQIIESAALALLAGLPPGQVKLDVFDPERLGESANFLYGLGEATEKVLGQKVRTTDKELAELLVEVEEHITFVTQKYLQGSFDSLTAYNQASGDVSEPYRLLVIFDYPSGFSRDQNYDQEQLDRFQKVLVTGRRCGVFTLIAHSGAAGEHANRVSQALPWLSRVDFNPGVLAAGLALDSAAEQRLRGSVSALAGATVNWVFEAVPGVPAEIQSSLIAHIERGLRTAADVRVDADRVSELTRLAMDRDVARGTRSREPVAAAYDPTTWWQNTSLDRVSAVVGRLGASDTARLSLDSQTASSILIGGRPGSGKSMLLHAVIMSLTQQYGPDELALYLVDFKEGVEFKQYATHHLPHAKVVAIESEREFGVSVLESLANEIVERGKLFRGAGSGEETNLGEYRRSTGRPMPRVVLIIDEFQVMFDRDDKIGNRAAELLERVLRTGRAFGVHTILASQTIAGMPTLGRHLPNLIPTRVVLQSADADSRLLLSDENADAKLLSRPGEAILNTRGGQREANQRFQSTYWEPADRAWVLEQLRLRAQQLGHHSLPIVFEGQRGASVEDVELETFSIPSGKAISLPLGMSMTLAGPIRVELRREPGSNLLIVMDEPGALLVDLAVLGRAGIATDLLDFGGTDENGEACLAAATGCPTTTVSRRREARARLAALAAIVDERLHLHDYAAPPMILAIHGLHRAREFDTAADFDEGSESGLLKKVARDGPEVGVHTLVWVDKKTSVDRRLSYEVLREFALRLCGPTSREDSLSLIDSDEAVSLHAGHAIFDDHDQSRRHRVRVFASPPPSWARHLLDGAQ